MRLFALIGTVLVLASGVHAQPATSPLKDPDRTYCPTRGVGESDEAYLERVRQCHCSCPTKRRHETQIDYLIRTRPVCEVRWLEKVRDGTTGDDTHEHFLERCGRGCAAVIAGDQAAVGVAALGLLGAGLGGGLAAGNEKPASP